MSGVYLFYETATDVPDFINQAQTEAGGTINGVEFSWVKNQLITNGNFANGTNSWTTQRITFAVTDGIASLTPNAQSTSDNYVQQIPTMIIGHKYLFVGTAKCHTADNYVFALFFGEASNYKYIKSISANTWETKSEIFTCQTNTWNLIRMMNSSNDATKVNEYKNLYLIDLTIAFPDDIPTSINDPRIQYIIEHGYIPTDTTGTYENITTQTLANVNVGVK